MRPEIPTAQEALELGNHNYRLAVSKQNPVYAEFARRFFLSSLMSHGVEWPLPNIRHSNNTKSTALWKQLRSHRQRTKLAIADAFCGLGQALRLIGEGAPAPDSRHRSSLLLTTQCRHVHCETHSPLFSRVYTGTSKTEARSAFRASLALSPGHANALWNEGQLAEEQHDFPAALSAFGARVKATHHRDVR